MSNAIFYVSDNNNFYGTGIHTVSNALSGNFNITELEAVHPKVIKTDGPIPVYTPITTEISIPRDNIPSNNIVNERVYSPEIEDPMTGELFRPGVGFITDVDGVTVTGAIPLGTPVINDYVVFPFTYNSVTFEQQSLPLLPEAIRGYPHLLVIDETVTPPIIREKNNDEKLKDLIPIKLAEIKGAFEQKITEGAPTSFGFTVDCKPMDISNWTSTLSLISLNPGMTEISIRDFDNISRTLTIAQYQQMCLEVGGYYMSLYNYKWTKDEEIKTSPTLESCESVTW